MIQTISKWTHTIKSGGAEMTIEGRTDRTGNVKITCTREGGDRQPNDRDQGVTLEIPHNEWAEFVRLLRNTSPASEIDPSR